LHRYPDFFSAACSAAQIPASTKLVISDFLFLPMLFLSTVSEHLCNPITFVSWLLNCAEEANIAFRFHLQDWMEFHRTGREGLCTIADAGGAEIRLMLCQ